MNRQPQISAGSSGRLTGGQSTRSMAGSVTLFISTLVLAGHVTFACPPGPVAIEMLHLRGQHNFFEQPLPEGINAATPRSLAPPTTGTNELVVLLVDFSNRAGIKGDDDFESLLFSGTDSMANYYDEVSYGQFTVDGEVYPDTGWYRAAQQTSYYINGEGGLLDTYPKNAQKLVEEAVNAADPTVNFAQYDNDSDGKVDCVIVVHSGYSASYDGAADAKFWPHAWWLSSGNGPGAITVDGVEVDRYVLCAELERATGTDLIGVGVFCHEYGHVLGLPDLYTTVTNDYESSYGRSWGLGTFALMAYGSWGADWRTPQRPTHMCAWSKIQLGWIDPTNVTDELTAVQIRQAETNADVYRLWTYGETSNEYFLIENRQQTGFDADLTGSGLLIYHVDENVGLGDVDGDGQDNWTDNQVQWDETHKFIDIECADQITAGHGTDADVFDDASLDTEPTGSAGVFFSSSTSATFDGDSSPSTVSYAGSDTYVSVTNIGASSATMTADAFPGPPAPLPPDLWVKDCDADTGDEPAAPICPAWWTSTDIWIDNDGDGIQDEPVENEENTLYARVRNREQRLLGAAGRVTVKFYYRDNSTGLVFPGQGAQAATVIGEKTINGIPAGGNETTSVQWLVPDPRTAEGHYCIGVVATCALDDDPSEVPWKDNNVAGVNLSVLYARAGRSTDSLRDEGGCIDPNEPVVADFDMENPTDQPKVLRLVADAEVPAGWIVEFEDRVTGQIWPESQDYFLLLPPHTIRPIRMRAYLAGVSHGQGGFVRVTQYDEMLYPMYEGIMGGIDFPIVVDCYAPSLVQDLVAKVVLDGGQQPGAAPAVRLDFTPVTTDLSGAPERVAYYNVYRGTDPNFVPGPATRVARILRDANPAIGGWQYYDADVQVGPWYDRRAEYYYVLGVVDAAAYEEIGYSYVAGTGNVVDNGIVRARFTEFGGSGGRFPYGSTIPADIAWLPISSQSQVFTWEGNLHYDDGGGPANHLLSPNSGAFEVIEAAHYLAGQVLSVAANADFHIAARHGVYGAQLVTSLEITNISGAELSDVDFAWMLDADLAPPPDDPREPCCPNIPWVGFGSGRWFGEEGRGVQTNVNSCAGIVPADMAVTHGALLDATAPPDEWTVSNPVGYQGATCAFDGPIQGDRRFLFQLPFDNTEGCVGFDQDLGIVTNFEIATWPSGASHTFRYSLKFHEPNDVDADGRTGLSDYAVFETCLDGPADEPIAANCATLDSDCDDDVDLIDFAEFQQAFDAR